MPSSGIAIPLADNLTTSNRQEVFASTGADDAVTGKRLGVDVFRLGNDGRLTRTGTYFLGINRYDRGFGRPQNDQIRNIIFKSTTVTIDDLDPGYTQSGAWTHTSAYPGLVAGHAGDYAYAPPSGSAAVTATAAWQLGGLAPGVVDLLVSWVPLGNRASNAPYRIYEGDTLLRTVRVDQRLAPLGTTVGWTAFQALGLVALSGAGPLRVVLGNDADGYVIADAVLVGNPGSIVYGGVTPMGTLAEGLDIAAARVGGGGSHRIGQASPTTQASAPLVEPTSSRGRIVGGDTADPEARRRLVPTWGRAPDAGGPRWVEAVVHPGGPLAYEQAPDAMAWDRWALIELRRGRARRGIQVLQ